MSAPEERPEPAGTVYGGRRAPHSGLLSDPLLRLAVAVGLVGVLVGVLFATGLFDGDEEPVVPATVGAPSSVPEPTTEAAEPSPTPSAEPSPTTPAGPPTGPTVLRAASGLCLGVDGDGEKAEAQLAACSGGPEQQWVVNPAAADVVTLTNAAYGQCLDVEGGSGDDGARMMQFPCHSGPNQQWRLSATGTGPVLLVAAHSGKCAQPEDDGAEAGDDVRQRTCDGRPAQQWTLG
ncbi:RICIN domain-containing protein [Micromonospora profundi]|uniref:RICIN domain-containing protein n=1 Tax=Micromonospora profundi TaxID=1420889 RepID=A0AAJ6HXW7_9ACTN|nr:MULTISPECIES: RICIN domain-containing protein [Micromonospora]KOX09214.1 ricin B lectin [Micromonospora sp. NRRL B-16802]WLS46059.1 RICIN domain-containing protein [Micromonospora profundi]